MFNSMNDIYHIIDNWLLISGYWDLDDEGKKLAIDKALREYLAHQICFYDLSGGATMPALVKSTPQTLMEGLEHLVDSKYHGETLRHVVHYIINVASNMQKYAIVWQVQEDEGLIQNPQVNYTSEGIWDSLVTHKDTKYSVAFKVAYEALNRNVTLKK